MFLTSRNVILPARAGAHAKAAAIIDPSTAARQVRFIINKLR